jgi:hypothetical protein
VTQQPEAYIGGAGELFEDADVPKCDDTRAFFERSRNYNE